MIAALIIEDEKPAARRLQRMLAKENIDVLEILNSVNSAVAWLQSNPQPPLVFCDIQLSDGIAFEIFEKIKINSPIIFTTAYDEYAIRAFKLNSIDYLLKPFTQEDLKSAIDKYKNFNLKIIEQDFSGILRNINQHKFYKERFLVKKGVYLRIITTENIDFFYSENKISFLHTFLNKEYIIDESLEKLTKILDPKKFFRINRQYIINKNAITEMIKLSNRRIKVILKDKKEIIVARERAGDFMIWLEK